MMKGETYSEQNMESDRDPLNPYLFIIVLELMVIEMQEDKQMTRINPDKEHKKITCHINHNKQLNNKDDRLSIFADNSSTITTEARHMGSARENICAYEKAS